MAKLHLYCCRFMAVGITLAMFIAVELCLSISPASSQPNAGFDLSIDGVNIAGDAEPAPVKKPKAAQEKIDPVVTGSTVSAKTVSVEDVVETPEFIEEIIPQHEISVRLLAEDAKRELKVNAQKNGNSVVFSTQNNYPGWIERSEVIIIDPSISINPESAFKTIPLTSDGVGELHDVPPDKSIAYLLRVYDQYGRYDQTKAKLLRGSPEDGALLNTLKQQQNIKVHGKTISVTGTHIPENSVVTVFGQPASPTSSGTFEITRILPPGEHDIETVFIGPDNQEEIYGERVYVADSEWFYVGIADLTLGKNLGEGAIQGVKGESYSPYYQKGRVAFYLKGKIKGEYLLTAALDTGEAELKKMFAGIDTKDPNKLLKRIDPDSYYAVYGDQSTRINDAPTSGKLYVRVDRGESHIMWGDFRSEIDGTKLLRSTRSLYGARAVYNSEQKTASGESAVRFNAYASQPDSISQREFHRGTGGSVFFLKRQDILPSTEIVEVIISDSFSGRIIERRRLTSGSDYELDAFQGVLFLKEPLSSYSSVSSPVRDGAFGENEVGLSISYEARPASGEISGYTYGGRAQAMLNDRMRIGVTGYQDGSGPADQEAYGVDFLYKLAKGSWISAEYAQTRGPGFGRSESTDGGLTINDIATAGSDAQTGSAWELAGSIDLSDYNPEVNAAMNFRYGEKSAGYSTYDNEIAEDETEWNVNLRWQAFKMLAFSVGHEHWQNASDKQRTNNSIVGTFNNNENFTIDFGVTQTTEIDPNNAIDGERIDVGVRANYKINDSSRLWVFGQTTATKNGNIDNNNRYGLGTAFNLNEYLSIEGEISHGTGGLGGLVKGNLKKDEGREIYVGYSFDPTGSSTLGDRFGEDGVWVAGSRHRYSDRLNVYVENQYDLGGDGYSSTAAYGLEFQPDEFWSVRLITEIGHISDPNASNFDRAAYSALMTYTDPEGISARLKGEFRDEESDDQTRNAETYAIIGGLNLELSDSWVLKADTKAVWSRSDQSSIDNGRYFESRLGFAHRPVDNDRLNLLLNYRGIYDLPGEDQINASGSRQGPAQRSNIFSIDGDYQLNEYVNLGFKYGYRLGEISTDRVNPDFTPASAHLGVARADVRLDENWEVFAAMRYMELPELDQDLTGVLVGAYRDVNEHVKVGVGYNFGQFSDDLADLTLDDEGVFVNFVAKF